MLSISNNPYVKLALEAVGWECYLGDVYGLPTHHITYYDMEDIHLLYSIITEDNNRRIHRDYNGGISALMYRWLIMTITNDEEYLDVDIDIRDIEVIMSNMIKVYTYGFMHSLCNVSSIGPISHDVQEILDKRDDDIVRQCLLPHTDIPYLLSNNTPLDEWLRTSLFLVRIKRIYNVIIPYCLNSKNTILYPYTFPSDIDFHIRE
jgi:hypothetical protein